MKGVAEICRAVRGVHPFFPELGRFTVEPGSGSVAIFQSGGIDERFECGPRGTKGKDAVEHRLRVVLAADHGSDVSGQRVDSHKGSLGLADTFLVGFAHRYFFLHDFFGYRLHPRIKGSMDFKPPRGQQGRILFPEINQFRIDDIIDQVPGFNGTVRWFQKDGLRQGASFSAAEI